MRQNELAAQNIINQFWYSQVLNAAKAAVKHRQSLQLFPPTDEQYQAAEKILDVLTTPPTSELSLAVPEKPKRARRSS